MDYFRENTLIRKVNLDNSLGVSPATAVRVLRDLNEDGTPVRVRDGKVWGYRLKEIQETGNPVLK